MSPTHQPNETARPRLARTTAAIRGCVMSVLGVTLGVLPASADELASDWVHGHNVRSRLVAGIDRSGAAAALATGDRAPARAAIVAGVEIDLADTWKTYWRNPGDAGGVPPTFDWTGSTNLARATVLYPAPKRMTDKSGTTVGYKADVVFPVLIEAANPAEPVGLKVNLAFGICREICVPGESEHAVSIAADADAMPPQLAAALSHVPSPTPPAGSPVIRKTEVVLDGSAPLVRLHAAFPSGRDGADAFVVGPAGEYVPMPVAKSVGDGDVVVFEIDLTMGADIAALRGKPITITLVSKHGQSETEVLLRP